MPKFRPNRNFKLNYAMQLTTDAMGNPSYAQKFKKIGEGVLSNISKSVGDFQDKLIDARTDTYKKVISTDKMYGGINRIGSFTKGTDKKYPYLFSRYDAESNPNMAIIAGGPGTKDRGDDFLKRDSKDGSVEIYQSNVNSNTQRRMRYDQENAKLKTQLRTNKDKESLKRLNADAQQSAQMYSNIRSAINRGGYENVQKEIDKASRQYSNFTSRGGAIQGEGFFGKIGDTKSGYTLANVINYMNPDGLNVDTTRKFKSGERKTFFGGNNTYGRGYNLDHIRRQNPVKYHTRIMLGQFSDLNKRAGKTQAYSNEFAKTGARVGREFKNSDNFVKSISVDSKSGLTNKTSLFDRIKSDKKSNE